MRSFGFLLVLAFACITLSYMATPVQAQFFNGGEPTTTTTTTTTTPYADDDDDDRSLSSSERSSTDDDFDRPVIDSINGSSNLKPIAAVTVACAYIAILL